MKINWFSEYSLLVLAKEFQSCIIIDFEVYMIHDRFGMDIFFTFPRRKSAKPIDATDNMTAVRNMKLYAFALGNDDDDAVCPAINRED